jgi:beta-phosphoglucomutase
VPTPIALAPGLAILFDMDGVLIHSTPMHTHAWEIYLNRLGLSFEKIRETMHGKHNAEIVAAIWGKDLPPDEAYEHGAAKERLYREMMAPVIEEHLVPGLHQFLERTRHVPRAVASNAEPLNVEFVLENSGLGEHFLTALNGHMVERPKPDPEIFLMAAKAVGVAPRNCIIFEDSEGGVRAARLAGGRVVALTTTRTDFPEADLVIADFRDERLEPWLISQVAR